MHLFAELHAALSSYIDSETKTVTEFADSMNQQPNLPHSLLKKSWN